MDGVHPIDLVIIAAYLALILLLGRKAAASTGSEEGFFLAGRRLGKVYQIFFNFGNSTEPQGAVSTASFVYERGASGAWYSFQMVFLNPYYWFMNVWFRRARVVTVADLFVERFNSRGLAQFYALFQVGVTALMIGFGCFTAYTIANSLVTKPRDDWTPAEHASIEAFRELSRLENEHRAGPLAPDVGMRLVELREARARGQISGSVPLLHGVLAKYVFYAVFAGVVAAYMALGGMTAAAFNEAVQGVLIIVFSVLLIPTGLHAIGGWQALGHRVPKEMFNLFGTEGTPQFTGWTIFAITLSSLVQINALSSNMNIMGSARTEFAARVGVMGFYAKRLMTVLWTFAGLIAIALLSGEKAPPAPDAVWGVLSRELLGPGLLGLMIIGIAAGVMSNLAAKSMAVSSLFVRNFCHLHWPGMPEKRGVGIGRWAIFVVLALGVWCAAGMQEMETVMRLVITVNVPFGAVIVLMFFWRRLTATAVWIALVASILINIALPLAIAHVPVLSSRAEFIQRVDEGVGQPRPLYFDDMTLAPGDGEMPLLVGTGRFNLELYLARYLGIDGERLSPNERLTVQYLWDVAFPFVLLIGVSLFTTDRQKARGVQFFGRMKTPVGPTPASDAAAMLETRRQPDRFDHLKLFGTSSSWEFTRWNRADGWGFLACAAVSGLIIAAFWFLLRWAGAGT